MRRPTRLVPLIALFLGCGQAPAPSWAPPSRPTTLHVAFDDIPAARAKVIPMSLTSSTGAGLELVAVKARAVIDEPLAFTELHLTFDNPEDRVLEGNFSIVLPQGAAISRFAMRNAQGWQEGEVVEKQRARAAYEDFLHRRQDPALLEQNAGNEFSARVFPIPARGRKELIVSYQQELTAAAPYVLPLQGLPRVHDLDVEAYLAGHAAPVQRLSQHDVTPAADFRVDPKPVSLPSLRNAELTVTRVSPVVGSQPEPLSSAVILVDTSASRALGMVEEARIVAQLAAEVAHAAGSRLLVAAYDQQVEVLYDGPASGFGADALGRMRQRLALGASNLGAALAWAGKEGQAHGISRVVLVTDGVPTAGETSGEKLRAVAAGLKAAGIERLDAVALGGIRDDDLLRSLVNAGLPRGGTVIDGSKDPQEIGRRLSQATRSGLKVEVEGAKFVFPREINGVQAGDEVLVYATVPEGQAVRVSVGGARAVTPDPARAERPLLERAWVGAKIRSLVEQERTAGPSETLSHEIVGLSTRYRVLSPKTSLLVLESDADYARFGIDRRALADILVAEGGRVNLLSRTAPEPIVKVAPPTRVVGHEIAGKKAALGNDKGDGDPEANPMVGDRGPSRPTAARAEPPAPMAAASASPMAPPPPPPPPPPRLRVQLEQRPATAAAAPSPVPAPAKPSPPMEKAEEPRMAPAPAMAPAPEPPPPPAAARVAAAPPPDRSPSRRPADGYRASEDEAPAAPPEPPHEDPYTGPFKTVMDLLSTGKVEPAVKEAFEWRKREPGDVMALVALGEGFEAAGEHGQAARAYGSIIDLFPGRADLRRFAGERMERLEAKVGLPLALDTFAKAVEERPDHPASHRLYAYTLLRSGQPEKAFQAIVAGLHRDYPPGRFAGVPRILAEDVGLIGAAWAKADPKRADEILRRVRAEGGTVEDGPSIRFVLNWETDANDVDFHIYDGEGGHAFYNDKVLRSGGELYADVTTGYGPECFTIREEPARRHGPYKLQAHYYSRGPMGYGMGKLEIIEHDGKGGLRFEERPFVVMVDQGFVDLGTVPR